jgi:hypothetical protein
MQHHARTDGSDVGHFLEIFHRHVKAPNLIDHPFASSFS